MFIYLILIPRRMANTKMMALFMVLTLIGFGVATIVIPMLPEVSAQGNMTGNQTANMTDSSMDSGKISGSFITP